jgi:hypothetical protein
MGNPNNWLNVGYDSIYVNGAPFSTPIVQRNILNFTSGGSAITVVVTDNPTLESTDVAISGGSGGASPVPGSTISTSETLTSPASNATYLIETSSGPVVVTIAGTPFDGVELSFIDASQEWSTHRFGFQPQAGAYVRNPENVAAADTTGQINVGDVSGESFTLKWFASISKWLPL